MEAIKKILIATDGSEQSQPAVNQGLQLAKMLGASVTALYVVDQIPLQSAPADSTVVFSIHALLENEGRKAVDDVKAAGERIGVAVIPLIVEGSPARRIVEIAADYDLVVIGTLGRSGLSKLLIGSVAERVTRYAPCPVLVVRAKKV